MEPTGSPKLSSLRRFQDRFRGSGNSRDSRERERRQEADADGGRGTGDGDGDAAAAAADLRQGRLSPRAHPGVARISALEPPVAASAHAQPIRQEPEAKGQVVGRMGVGVTSRGAGGLDTAQPVGKAIGAASADDYGVHPACIAAPGPVSPNHKRSSSSGHSHGMVSRALQAVKSKVARGDGKSRSEVGHAQDGIPGGKHREEPAMHTALAAVHPQSAAATGVGDVITGGAAPAGSHDWVGGGGGGGGADVGLPAAVPSSAKAGAGDAQDDTEQRRAARADAEAEVAAAVLAANEMRAADPESS